MRFHTLEHEFDSVVVDDAYRSIVIHSQVQRVYRSTSQVRILLFLVDHSSLRGNALAIKLFTIFTCIRVLLRSDQDQLLRCLSPSCARNLESHHQFLCLISLTPSEHECWKKNFTYSFSTKLNAFLVQHRNGPILRSQFQGLLLLGGGFVLSAPLVLFPNYCGPTCWFTFAFEHGVRFGNDSCTFSFTRLFSFIRWRIGNYVLRVHRGNNTVKLQLQSVQRNWGERHR